MPDKKKKPQKNSRSFFTKIKNFIPATLMLFSPSASMGNNPVQPEKENNNTPINMQQQSLNLTEAKSNWDNASHGIYNGVNVDMRTLTPEDVAHVFESGMNPCITNGRTHISRASYLGLCQMDLNIVVPAFVNKYKDKYPKLYATMKQSPKGPRTEAFLAQWKILSNGPQAAEFKADQFETMWGLHYERIFDKLAATNHFPKITLENYANTENFLYSAAVISCVNQSPKRTFEFFQRAYNNVKNKNDLDAIALESYKVKSTQWPKYSSRYKDEAKLLRQKQKEIKLANIYYMLAKEKTNTAVLEMPEEFKSLPQIDLNSAQLAKIQEAAISINKTDLIEKIKDNRSQYRKKTKTKQNNMLALYNRKKKQNA